MNIDLDNNILLIPLAMLMMNLMGPIIQKKMPKAVGEFLDLPFIEPFMFFFLMYVATRKFWISLGLGLIAYFIIYIFMNEKSDYYILPKRKQVILLDDNGGSLAIGKPALARQNAMIAHYHDKQEEIQNYKKIMRKI